MEFASLGFGMFSQLRENLLRLKLRRLLSLSVKEIVLTRTLDLSNIQVNSI